MNLSALSMGLTRPQISGGYAAIRDAAIAAARRNNAALWYAGNSSDLSGFVYQDSTGTTPATNGTGGLSANLLSTANQYFQAGNTWTPGANWTVVPGTPGYAESTSADNTYISIPVTITSGSQYTVTYTVSNYTSGSVRFWFGVFGQNGTARTANGTYTQTLTASSSQTVLTIVSTLFSGRISDVSIQVLTTGDPVGLLLDRSYGASNLGPELVTNGDFSSGTTGWTASGGASQTVIGGELVVTNTAGGGTEQVIQDIFSGVVAGNTYRVTITGRKGTSSSYQIGIEGNSISYYFSGALNNTVAETRSFVFTAVAGQTVCIVKLRVLGIGTSIFDNVQIKQLLGYPALQATSGNRPTLELQANGYYGMRFDGSNDLLTTTIQSPTTAGSIIVGGNAGSTTSQPAGYLNNATTGGIWLDGFTGTEDLAQATPILVVINTAVPVVINEAKVITADINGASSRLLKNGAVIGSGTVSASTVATALFGIGGPGATYSGNAYSGLITLVCTSSVALSNSDRIAIERFAALLSGASYV